MEDTSPHETPDAIDDENSMENSTNARIRDELYEEDESMRDDEHEEYCEAMMEELLRDEPEEEDSRLTFDTNDCTPAARVETSAKNRKRRVENEASERRTRRVRKLVTSTILSSQSGSLARSIRNWVKFLMGMPATINAFPSDPSDEEIAIWRDWAHMRYERVSGHLETIKNDHSGDNKADGQLRYNEEFTRLKKIIQPPNFWAASNVPAAVDKFSWSAKVACERDVRQAGFSRITFQWQLPTFDASGWNASLSTIILRHYANWEKTQPGRVWDGVENMTLILERWIQGQGREMRMADRLGPAMNSVKEMKAHRSAVQRMKKKIAEKRFQMALKMLPKEMADIVAIFDRVDVVSDWEDDEVDERYRVPPVWRSAELTHLTRTIDEIMKTVSTKTVEIKQLTGLLYRHHNKEVESDFDLASIPKKLPINAYDAAFWEQLSELEREVLEPCQAAELAGALKGLSEKIKSKRRPGGAWGNEQFPQASGSGTRG